MIPTPHIAAPADAFADTVLMPGDPKRARFFAENFLTGAALVNDVRGVQGYTGSAKGQRISVMASGMGMPSIGIYSYELFRFYGVENIIRVGSAGGVAGGVKLRDIVLGMGACTDSAYAAAFRLPGTFAPIADYTLLKTCADTASALGLPVRIGNLLSTDAFYTEEADLPPEQKSAFRWRKMGVLAVEMEAAALYMNAAAAGKRALCLCTVSDHLFTGESLSAAERETSFSDMLRLALETALSL